MCPYIALGIKNSVKAGIKLCGLESRDMVLSQTQVVNLTTLDFRFNFDFNSSDL